MLSKRSVQSWCFPASVTVILALMSGTSYAQSPGVPTSGGSDAGRGGRLPIADFLVEADKDKDGKASFEDVIAVRPEIPRAAFDRFDANRDGFLTQEEITASGRPDDERSTEAIVPKKIKFEGKTWTADLAETVEVVEFKGKIAIHMTGGERSYIYLPEAAFQDGVIEADLAGPIFTGIGFRGRENGRRVEKVYFRPQNANTERHANTVQYGVIGREDGHWRYLRENFPGKFEAGADIKPEEWFHVRYEIKGETVKVFVNGGKEPVLAVDKMLDGVSKGTVGIWGWDSYFANFKYTPAD